MKNISLAHVLGVAGALLVPGLAVAALNIPHTFQTGDVLSASDMNDNFQAIKQKVEALEADLNTAPRACTREYASCSASDSCTVTCPSGKTLTGGGGACAPSNDQGSTTENLMKYSRPSSDLSAWDVVCSEATKTSWAYAVCCN